MGSPPAAVSRRRCRFHRVRSAPVQSSHSRQHARHRASRCVNKNGTIWQRVVSPPSCSASPTLRSGSAAASHRSRQSEDHAGRRRGDSGRRGCAESGLAGVPPAVWPLAAPCAENCGRRRVEAKRTAASLVCRRVRALPSKKTDGHEYRGRPDVTYGNRKTEVGRQPPQTVSTHLVLRAMLRSDDTLRESHHPHTTLHTLSRISRARIALTSTLSRASRRGTQYTRSTSRVRGRNTGRGHSW